MTGGSRRPHRFGKPTFGSYAGSVFWEGASCWPLQPENKAGSDCLWRLRRYVYRAYCHGLLVLCGDTITHEPRKGLSLRCEMSSRTCPEFAILAAGYFRVWRVTLERAAGLCSQTWSRREGPKTKGEHQTPKDLLMVIDQLPAKPILSPHSVTCEPAYACLRADNMHTVCASI